MTDKEIMWKAIDTYGHDAQQDMCIEEMSELTKAILKYRRKFTATGETPEKEWDDIAEEIADVEIMLEQLKMMFGNEVVVYKQKEYKLNRLKARWEGK